MQIKVIPVTPIEQNCRVLYLEDSKRAVVVDPGGDVGKIANFIENLDLKLEAIWLTHYHFDHCGGVADLKEQYSVPVYGHQGEKEFRSLVQESASRFGLSGSDLRNCPEPDHYIDEGDVLKLAEIEFQVFFTPGHSPGHLVFYQAETKTLIAGDTVFLNSIGRTDLPGGNHQLLIESIRTKILKLPEDTVIMPGHGPDTTLAHEKATNPFLS